jgi:hypothetical protein
VLAVLACTATVQVSAATAATSSGSTAQSGGAGMIAPTSTPSTPARPTVPGYRAKIIRGVAYAPASAPIQVQRVIWAGNKIRRKPYVWGGGHGVWNAVGYDCSGSVSYVLHAAGLLPTSMDSIEFEAWGLSGVGQWVTVYTDPAHAFLQVAGIRLDTSAEGDPHPSSGSGPRWRPLMRRTRGFQPRHPAAL